MALTANFALNMTLTYTKTTDLGTVPYTLNLGRGKTFTNGTGANKAQVLFDDQRTLADGANETIDLRDGTLTDALGVAVTIDILRALYIKNGSTDASLLIGGAAGTQLGLFNDVTDVLKLPPGGEFLFIAPDATGVDLTTNADLKLAHDGTGTSTLTYDIIVVGED
jgi:hypothetical protein